MNLAIETSGLVSSVAVGNGNILKGELTIQGGLTHSEQLVPHISEVLQRSGVAKQDLTAIVVSVGPGSFTGLRIGLATAKAMAYGLQIPLVGVTTMEGLAYNAMYVERLVAVLLDAQKRNVYAALYRMKGTQLQEVVATHVDSLQNVLEDIKKYNEPVLFMGDGAGLAIEEISAYDESFAIAPATMVIPRAGALLMAAQSRIEQGKFDDPMTAVPLYLRRSEAEVLWEKRKGLTKG